MSAIASPRLIGALTSRRQAHATTVPVTSVTLGGPKRSHRPMAIAQRSPEDDYMTSSALLRRGRRDRGATLVEYALMLSLVAVVCTTAIRGLGNKSSDGFDDAHAGHQRAGPRRPRVAGAAVAAAAVVAGWRRRRHHDARTHDHARTDDHDHDDPGDDRPPSSRARSSSATRRPQSRRAASGPRRRRSRCKSTSGAGVPGAIVTIKVRSLKNGTWSESDGERHDRRERHGDLHDADNSSTPARTRSRRCSSW